MDLRERVAQPVALQQLFVPVRQWAMTPFHLVTDGVDLLLAGTFEGSLDFATTRAMGADAFVARIRR